MIIEQEGKLVVGPSRTHLDAESPFIKSHHRNWRQKALERVSYQDLQKLHYSAPMTVGKKDLEKIRQKILTMLEEIGKTIDAAPNEELVCLNIDFFRLT